MIRILPISFILASGVLTSALADQKDTIRDMARFDKAFIPAFFATWEGDGAGAHDAVAQLEEAWETLKRKQFAGAAPEGMSDHDTDEMQLLVDQVVARASRDMGMAEAHMALVELRHALSKVRHAEGTPYILDHVVETQRFVATAAMHLARGDEQMVAETLSKAIASWKSVVTFPLNKVLYSLDYYSLGEMALHRDSATQFLEDALAAVRSENWDEARTKISDAADHVESYYKLFGAFE